MLDNATSASHIIERGLRKFACHDNMFSIVHRRMPPSFTGQPIDPDLRSQTPMDSRISGTRLRIRKPGRARRASARGRVVACMRAPALFARTLARYAGLQEDQSARFSVFGIIEEACVPSDIRDDAFIEQLARAIHQDYVTKSQARGETEATNPSMVPWEELPRDLREATVAQAARIGAMLEAINAVVVPGSADVPGFSFTGREIENLARMEHEQWSRERIAQGWTYGPDRDNRRKRHPVLTDWDGLPEVVKVKDRDAVREIPGILHEAGYQIFRLPPTGTRSLSRSGFRAGGYGKGPAKHRSAVTRPRAGRDLPLRSRRPVHFRGLRRPRRREPDHLVRRADRAVLG